VVAITKTMFSNKTKIADAKWKIETFKQEKWNTADFMIEFDTLAIKADMDELHTILESLKKWKITFTSVRQRYKFTKEYQDYKTGTGMIYSRQEQSINIEKSNDNSKMRNQSVSTATSMAIYVVATTRHTVQ